MAGNIGASALVKSAASIGSQIAEYQDKMQALQWNSSAQTDADYEVYSKYLNTRIEKLSNQGSLSSSSKALTLTTTLQSANRSYVSNSIQRTTINILEGSATAVEKQNAIVGFYKEAVANGDENLAQNLQQQYDSLSIQIQNEAEAAANAAEAQAKKNAAAVKLGYTSQIDALKAKLTEFGSELKDYGQGTVTAQLQDFSKKQLAELKKLGVEVPEGAQLNNGSIISAIINTIGNSYVEAGNAISITDPSGAQSMYDNATNIANGNTTFNVAGNGFTLEDADFYAKNPTAFFTKYNGIDVQGNATYKLQRAAIDGYQYNQQGEIIPTYSSTDISAVGQKEKGERDRIKQELEKAGLSVDINENGVITITPSDKSTIINNALKGYGLPATTKFQVVLTDGGYQFNPITDSGGNKRLLVLSKDQSGKFGLYDQRFDAATGKSYVNLLEKDSGYNSLENGLGQNALTSVMQEDLVNLLQNYQAKGNGYTEKTVIPQIAAKYFNNNFNAAADAVYRARRPLERSTEIAASTSKQTGIPTTGTPTVQSLTIATKGQNNNIDAFTADGIKRAFEGFKIRPNGYTESTIIPDIAKKFFGNDTKKAAAAVYAYRKNAGLENPSTPPSPPTQNNKSLTKTTSPPKVNTGINTLPTVQTPSTSSTNSNQIQTYLKSAFNNYSTQPKGYTENVVLKNVANQFFGGDIKKASDVVYPYRKQNFGS